MYFDRKCKITFVSHGATIYTEEGRLSDAANYPPLSEAGIEEMNNLVSYLKARRVKNDVIYSSPSVRTTQSAMIISKPFKKEFEIVSELTPRRCGAFNGLTISNIIEKYPKGLNEVLAKEDLNEDEFGESLPTFIKRISEALEAIIEENIGSRIIIVTHPDVIKAVICSALNIPASKFMNIIIRTGSATQISYFENWAAVVYTDYTPLS